jgi:hypothetical protein
MTTDTGKPPMTADALKSALRRIKATYDTERKQAAENLERAQQLYADRMERAHSDALAASIAVHEAWMRGADPEEDEPS